MHARTHTHINSHCHLPPYSSVPDIIRLAPVAETHVIQLASVAQTNMALLLLVFVKLKKYLKKHPPKTWHCWSEVKIHSPKSSVCGDFHFLLLDM